MSYQILKHKNELKLQKNKWYLQHPESPEFWQALQCGKVTDVYWDLNPLVFSYTSCQRLINEHAVYPQ